MENGTLLTAGIILLLFVLAILNILYPFATGSRKQAAKLAGILFAAFLVNSIIHANVKTDTPAKTVAQAPSTPAEPAADQAPKSALAAGMKTGGSIPASCGKGGLAIRDVVYITGSHDLRSEPDLNAPKIKNEKLSAIVGEDAPQKVDASVSARRLCVQKDWTEIQVVTPDWLTSIRGWVPNSAIHDPALNADKGRFVEADFYWDKDTKKYKSQIVAVVNKIARENAKCATPNPGTVSLSKSKSKPGDPVFFVTCEHEGSPFNVWFRPGDADGEQSFAAKEPIAQSDAVLACEQAAKRAATHPSTVSFSRLWDLVYMPFPSGRARVVSSFTAKNDFNLELKYRIDCLFEGQEMIETTIAEALD